MDSSDPDTDFPNIEHAFQTAEAIRKSGKPEWFQLVGLIHDLGKIMFKWGLPDDGQDGSREGPQWALGGDTWVVGCRIPECVVYPEFNNLNPDMHDPTMSTKTGIYEHNCGLRNLKFAFGHDEYMYQMLKYNKCNIPEDGLQMIRLHSCYPVHTADCYSELLAVGDAKVINKVRDFNTFDLYTKMDKRPDIDLLWSYYQSLIDKYCPGKLKW